MLSAAYIRNGVVNVGGTDTITDDFGDLDERVTFASLLNTAIKNSDVATFNRFSKYMKFTNIFYGASDGINIQGESSSNLVSGTMTLYRVLP